MEQRVSVICGAGVSESCGWPSTEKLTLAATSLPGSLIKNTVEYRPGPVPSSTEWARDEEVWSLTALLGGALKGHYSSPNFETYVHALETLEPLALSLHNIAAPWVDNYRPVSMAYMEIFGRYEPLLRAAIIRRERLEVIRRIFESINQATIQVNANEALQKARGDLQGFFERVESVCKCQIFNLNYDDLLDEMLPNCWDGFSIHVDGSLRFDSSQFTKESLPDKALLHLHGSVRYGYAKSEHGEPPELLKFTNRRAALQSLDAAISNNDAFRGDRAFTGTLYANAPMISGFQKADKLALAPSPFGYYYHAYIKEMLGASRIIVLGYSGSDPHMNTWLYEAAHQRPADFWLVYVTNNKWLGPIIETRESNFLSGFEPDGRKWQQDSGVLLVGSNVIAITTGLPLDQQAEARLLEFLLA